MVSDLTRGQFLKLFGIGALSTLTHNKSLAQAMKNTDTNIPFYVGTYTDGASKGIYLCNFNKSTGKITQKDVTENIINPSFLTFGRYKHFLYAVSETDKFEGKDGGSVDAYRVHEDTGELEHLNTQPSFGAAPCFISVDHTNRFLMVANYNGGNVTVYPIKNDGSLGERSEFIQYHGKSVNPKRQNEPHAHCILPSPDNRFVMSADLGTDKVRIFHFDDKKGTLLPAKQPFAKVKPGSGPRHIRFHPNAKWVYVLSEMASTITVFDYNSETGSFSEKQTISMLPDNFSGKSTAAELHITSDGTFLYASNRGDDSIVVYTIDPDLGKLTFIQRQLSGGKIPRHFILDPSEEYVLVANKESNNIVVFERNSNTGKISPAGKTAEIPAPVCIQFV